MSSSLLDKLFANSETVKEEYTLEDALEKALADTTPTRAGVPRKAAMSKGIKIELNEIPYKGEFESE